MASKFTPDDKVLVIEIDKEIASDNVIGNHYSSTLLEVGTVISCVDSRKYPILVRFDHLDEEWNAWYYDAHEIVLYTPDMNIETLRLLYGRKNV